MPNRHKKFELSPRLRLGVGRGYSQNQILKIGAIICLVLALFLTWHAIGLIFSSSHSSAAPAVLGASDTKPADAGSDVQFVDHKVQKGETLFNIAQQSGVSWTTIATLNNLKSPFTLKPGEILHLPK